MWLCRFLIEEAEAFVFLICVSHQTENGGYFYAKKVYRTAIYCRLSREDGDKIESNSIEPGAICEDYIARQTIWKSEPYTDDGYSGELCWG